MKSRVVQFAILTVGAILAASGPASAQENRANARLHGAIDRAIHADGPFFLPSEHALIERKCGYAPGGWDGNNVSFSNDMLLCANGRRVSDPEVRAMMAVAGARISRRVNEAMDSPEIRNAIAAVSGAAVRRAFEALRDDRTSRRRRR